MVVREVSEAASPFYETVKQVMVAIEAEIRGAFADGKITFSEVLRLLSVTGQSLGTVSAGFLGVPAAERREIVIQAVQDLYNDVVVPLDIPGIPGFVEVPMEKILAQFLPTIVGAAYDAALKLAEKIWPPQDPTDPKPIHVFTGAHPVQAGLDILRHHLQPEASAG
jgi:hypothetical protein